MEVCELSPGHSVLQHGEAVWYHLFQLILTLQENKLEKLKGWQIPHWLIAHREQILARLLPLHILWEYTTYHDCGKPYCLTIDQQGKRHFPNHTQMSHDKWLEVGGNPLVANLMLQDMVIHTVKAVELDKLSQKPEAISLLLAGLAEIHANAKMFGGIESDSFKIKFKQINRRGRAICNVLLNNIKVEV